MIGRILTVGLGSFGSTSWILTGGLGAYSGAPDPDPVFTTRLMLVGTSAKRLGLDGASMERLTVRGTSQRRNTLEGASR